MGGFITPSSKSSSPDWGPSGKEEGCQRGLAPQPLTVCLYEIEWVSICLCHIWLCYHNLFRSLTCLGGVRTVKSRISFRNEERAHAITLTTPMLPTFYVMVFDTRVSSEQTVKQQEHILQGVAQMVMNMETVYVVPPAKANSDLSGYFRKMFCVCWKFSSKIWHLHEPISVQLERLTAESLPGRTQKTKCLPSY